MFNCSIVQLFNCSIVHLFICSFIYSFICSFVHLFICSFVCSFYYSCIWKQIFLKITLLWFIIEISFVKNVKSWILNFWRISCGVQTEEQYLPWQHLFPSALPLVPANNLNPANHPPDNSSIPAEKQHYPYKLLGKTFTRYSKNQKTLE